MNAPSSRSGQIGIAVMLMMVVMSTVGFALAIRASRDVQTSRQGQDAVQSFSAAEAIIEDVLADGEAALESSQGGNVSNIENISGSYTVNRSNTQTLDLEQGLIVEVPLTSPNGSLGNMSGNTVSIEWADPGTVSNCSANPASIIVSVINNNAGTVVSRTIASAGCNRNDGISVSTAQSPTRLARRLDVTLTANDSLIRVTPLYNDTPIYIRGTNWTLPTQQYVIRSVARNTLGRETKAIQVDRTRDFAPSVLNYGLVSGTDITK